MWVIKLGGSLQDDAALPEWLAALARYGGGRVIVVPGGGAFADQVRAAQRRWSVADPVAHRMALLAMDQYGMLLAGLCPELRPAASPEAIRAILRRAGVALWLPAVLAGNADDLPQNWDVSSDSIAAWFAGRMNAECLVLVKSCPLPEHEVSVCELAELGIADRAFPQVTERACYRIVLLHRSRPQAMVNMLLENRPQPH